MSSGRKALKQINERAYYEQYLGQRKEIILVGIGFSKGKRNISDYSQAKVPGKE
jgi:hypothetical protein